MSEDRVEAVERALTILEAFREGEEALSLAALAEKTGFYKSTILRLAASLERFGYLAREPSGMFRLGPSLWLLGSLYRRSFDLGEHVRPELRRLVEATTETASYFVREGNERVCLYRLNSPRPVRHHLDEGARLPLERGATGRILLAFSNPQNEAFAAIRAAGHYVSLGERDPEVAAAAVPVLDTAGHIKGVLGISALLSRFDAKAQACALAALHESADRLATHLLQD